MELKPGTVGLDRNYLVEPMPMDHRDTMNTEKTKNSLADIRSPMGDFLEQILTLVFFVRHLFKILACRGEFSRSAAVCAEHQPQPVGPTGRLGFQRVPAGIRGRCGWSSADTAALLWLRLRRSVVIASLSSSRRFPLHCHGLIAILRNDLPQVKALCSTAIRVHPCASVVHQLWHSS